MMARESLQAMHRSKSNGAVVVSGWSKRKMRIHLTAQSQEEENEKEEDAAVRDGGGGNAGLSPRRMKSRRPNENMRGTERSLDR
jgi:hypothetical protein